MPPHKINIICWRVLIKSTHSISIFLPSRRCYNCGGLDHHAKECKLPPQPKKCHFCQSIDHMVANCPIKAQQSSPGSQGNPSSLRGDDEEHSHPALPPETSNWRRKSEAVTPWANQTALAGGGGGGASWPSSAHGSCFWNYLRFKCCSWRMFSLFFFCFLCLSSVAVTLRNSAVKLCCVILHSGNSL